MNARIVVAGRTIEAEPGTTIMEAAEKGGILPDSYLFLVGGRPVPMDTPIEDGMLVRAVKVASGG